MNKFFESLQKEHSTGSASRKQIMTISENVLGSPKACWPYLNQHTKGEGRGMYSVKKIVEYVIPAKSPRGRKPKLTETKTNEEQIFDESITIHPTESDIAEELSYLRFACGGSSLR